ncbi:MAG: 50S ribosomal protein L29 [Planctomycetota bacterium]
MKAESLRDMSYEELLSQRTLLQKEIFELRLKKARGETPKAGEQREKRRDLARVMTVLGEYKKAMDVVNNDEEVAVKALRQHRWDVQATVQELELAKIAADTGVSGKLAALALKLGVGRTGQSDLARAKNLLAAAKAVSNGGDEAAQMAALARFNRDGLETAAEFRQVVEKSLVAARPGVAAVVIRGALADAGYNLDRATARVDAVQKLAQESGLDAPLALRTLQATRSDADLALKRLKKKAKTAAKA